MTRARVVFRCDASPLIGAGHVMRCLALADGFMAAGAQVMFAVREGTRAFLNGFDSAKVEIVDLKGPAENEPAEMAKLAGESCDFLVVDHYSWDRVFEAECRRWASCILVLDDQTGRVHDCDILVDSGAIGSEVYAGLVPPAARVLAGPSFALLRRIIMARREEALRRRDGRPVENLLVSFGATDPTNATGMLLEGLNADAMGIDITIAISAHAPHLEMIRNKVTGRLRLVLDADMPEVMVQADFAVGAAGSSAFERACLGLPSIMLVVAENQRGIAKAMAKSGAALVLNVTEIKTSLVRTMEMLRDDAPLRVAMARKAAHLVDGRGPRRVLEIATG